MAWRRWSLEINVSGGWKATRWQSQQGLLEFPQMIELGMERKTKSSVEHNTGRGEGHVAHWHCPQRNRAFRLFDFYSRMRQYWSRCEEEQKSKEALNSTLRPWGRYDWEGLQGKRSNKFKGEPSKLSVKARKMEVPLKRMRVPENLPSGAVIPGGTRKGWWVQEDWVGNKEAQRKVGGLWCTKWWRIGH